jgi:hypothetical protein
MKYATEVGSGVIHTKFHKYWLWHSKVKWGREFTDIQTHSNMEIA